MLRLAVADRIGQERFELWFGTGTQLIPQADRVSVEVPNQFTLEWLRKNFRRDIEAAVQDVLGAGAAIEFRVNPHLQSTSKIAGQPPCDAPAIPNSPIRVACPETGNGEPTSRRSFAQLGTYVVGDANRVAHTSAGVVIRQPGSINPFFLYGPPGVGKTHLLEGIWSAVRSLPVKPRAVYLSAEQFTNSFIEALQGKGLPSFRQRYRNVDLLIIDDVQFLCGKRATQVELQQTVDTLMRQQRQLAFAADRPPAQLTDLSSELVARFSGGLVCMVQPPDYAMRLSILENWSRAGPVPVPQEVLELIAEQLTEDVRLLRGALNRMYATSQALSQPVSVTMAREALADLVDHSRQRFGLEEIEQAVCALFELDRHALKSKRRAKAVSQARMLAMWLARKHTRAAFSEIGEFFGRRSHATVIAAHNAVDGWRRDGAAIPLPGRDCHISETIRQLESRLRTG